MKTRTETVEQQHVLTATEPCTPTETPLLPFIFRYRGYCNPVPGAISCTDPTAGEWTEAQTTWDGKVVDDGTEDADETDDGSNPQTGLLADSGTKDDEE